MRWSTACSSISCPAATNRSAPTRPPGQRSTRNGRSRAVRCVTAHGKPSRGEVWLVDFGDPIGREQSGRRPAVVVSADLLSEAAPAS
jgi:PemK-like, MazF-like toxin of type II toxin-antitoxin system